MRTLGRSVDKHLLLPDSLESVAQRLGAGERGGLRLSCGEVLEVWLCLSHARARTHAFPSLPVGYSWIGGYPAHVWPQVHRLEGSWTWTISGVGLEVGHPRPGPPFPQWNPGSQDFGAGRHLRSPVSIVSLSFHRWRVTETPEGSTLFLGLSDALRKYMSTWHDPLWNRRDKTPHMAAGLGCRQLGMILPLLVKPQWRGSSRGALWEVGRVQPE